MRIARGNFYERTFRLMLSVLLVCGCAPPEYGNSKNPETQLNRTEQNPQRQTMKLTSRAFENGVRLDAVYTVEGQDISPPLAWSAPPAGTKSFAIICDDPDAPSARHPGPEPWVHWVIFNIPGEMSEIPPKVGQDREPGEISGARQGRNSWPENNIGYRGPAPPHGSGPHRYVFRLYALDLVLSLPAGATKAQLLTAMERHILAEGQLIGIYER